MQHCQKSVELLVTWTAVCHDLQEYLSVHDGLGGKKNGTSPWAVQTVLLWDTNFATICFSVFWYATRSIRCKNALFAIYIVEPHFIPLSACGPIKSKVKRKKRGKGSWGCQGVSLFATVWWSPCCGHSATLLKIISSWDSKGVQVLSTQQ